MSPTILREEQARWLNGIEARVQDYCSNKSHGAALVQSALDVIDEAITRYGYSFPEFYLFF